MKTILVVDELLYCRQLLSFALRKSGYDVVTAEDGLGAIEAVKKGGVDLMILEAHFSRGSGGGGGGGGMDGLSVLRVMRANPDWAGLPVFMVTAAENRNQIVQAMQVGVQAYILKSQFDLDSLLGRIEKSIGRAMTGGVGGEGSSQRLVEIEGDIEEAAGSGRR